MRYNVLKRLQVPAKSEKLKDLRDFVTKTGKKMGMSLRQINGLKLCIDEACSNVIRHAYTGLSVKDPSVIVEMFNHPQYVETRIIDYGKDVNIDVDSLAKPDLQKYVDMGKKGGLGLFMIKKFMDEVIRKRENGANYLIMRKYVERPESYWTRVQKNLQWNTMPIKVKFTFISTLTISVLLFTLYIYFFNSQKSSLMRQFLFNTEKLAVKSADNAKSYILARDNLNLTLFLSELQKRDSTVVFAEAINSADEIIAHTDTKRIYKKYTRPDIRKVEKKEDMEKGELLYNKEKLLFFGVILKTAGIRIGELHLAFSKSKINAEVAQLQNRITLTFSTIFLWTIGILGSYFLGLIFLQPVKELTEEIKRIGKEGLGGRLYFKGKGELAEVATAFNKMMESIRQAEVELTDTTRLRKEMQLAQSIQQTLLPKTIPQIEGYEIGAKYDAAMEVGGDYYDFFEVDENSLGIAVGDVSGKGIGGALIMTMTRTALRLEARDNKNAANVLAHLNATLDGEFKKGMYITMYYVVLDAKRRIINYSSAGHNPMILYRGDTGQMYNLNPKGFAVGLNLGNPGVFQKAIKDEAIRLRKGDLLFIYTDGITEAMNSRREEYGEFRLLEAIKKFNHLPAPEIADKVLEDIKQFTGAYPQSDDITFVVLKEKASVSEVEYNTRVNLFKLIEEEGMSIRQACDKLNVSQNKYYYLKKIKDKSGLEGLKQDIDEEPRTEIELMDIETSQKMLEVVVENPAFSYHQIQEALDTDRFGHLKVDTKLIVRELKKLNLTTTDKRERFAKRQMVQMQQGKKSVFLRGGTRLKRDEKKVESFLEGQPAAAKPPITIAAGSEAVSSAAPAQGGPKAPERSSFLKSLFKRAKRDEGKTETKKEPEARIPPAAQIKPVTEEFKPPQQTKPETAARPAAQEPAAKESPEAEETRKKERAEKIEAAKKRLQEMAPSLDAKKEEAAPVTAVPVQAETPKPPGPKPEKPPPGKRQYAKDFEDVKKLMKDIPPPPDFKALAREAREEEKRKAAQSGKPPEVKKQPEIRPETAALQKPEEKPVHQEIPAQSVKKEKSSFITRLFTQAQKAFSSKKMPVKKDEKPETKPEMPPAPEIKKEIKPPETGIISAPPLKESPSPETKISPEKPPEEEKPAFPTDNNELTNILLGLEPSAAPPESPGAGAFNKEKPPQEKTEKELKTPEKKAGEIKPEVQAGKSGDKKISVPIVKKKAKTHTAPVSPKSLKTAPSPPLSSVIEEKKPLAPVPETKTVQKPFPVSEKKAGQAKLKPEKKKSIAQKIKPLKPDTVREPSRIHEPPPLLPDDIPPPPGYKAPLGTEKKMPLAIGSGKTEPITVILAEEEAMEQKARQTPREEKEDFADDIPPPPGYQPKVKA